MRTIASAIEHPLVISDAGGEIVEMNPAGLALHGFVSVDELRGALRAAPDLLEVRDARDEPVPADQGPASRAARGEVVTDLLLHVRRRDTGRSWVGLYTARRLPGRREPPLFMVSIHDVTARDEAERALRESEAKYRDLFDHLTTGFTLCRAIFEGDVPVDYVHEEANLAFEVQTGLRREDVLGRRITEVLPGIRGDPARWIEVLGEVARTGVPVHYEQHMIELDRWYDATAYRPKPGYFAVVFLDVTERKRTEERLREANERLREADRRKDEFLGVLSHELRNPLATIGTSVHLLERAAPDSPQAGRAKEVLRRQTEHLARLVDDLLDVTRVTRGKIQLHRRHLDLRAVARRTCDDHRALFESRGIALRIDTTPGAVWIDADATRISQVIGNLLQNAAKFTPAGGSVSVHTGVAEGDAELRVRDDGVGMEPSEIDRMFQPFAQSERSLARTRGGLGLGLALVRGLVELHGGTVRAHSAGPGRGSEFVVRLPRVPDSEATAASPAKGAAAGRHVLVVEDNPDAAQSLGDLLELFGHRVALAHDGRTGIALARELRPDVVLCDIGLPDVSGYEVARALRADPSLRGTRLVALSGYAQPEDRDRAKEAGFDAHLAKPAPLERLEALIAGEP
ncbi:hybrid sensor histidine kinase/response regulator [Anaeromyxobacter oryzisoli]|uniref:hybrid sensor histidine kinase/response regulator n=1 Tax=Anaeromyxobacter oryzisoli TaxID=2925408 RepID=UPI001F59FC50|nr:ATP-binding protein [Anaeromyxobacter sp. SG63]